MGSIANKNNQLDNRKSCFDNTGGSTGHCIRLVDLPNKNRLQLCSWKKTRRRYLAHCIATQQGDTFSLVFSLNS